MAEPKVGALTMGIISSDMYDSVEDLVMSMRYRVPKALTDAQVLHIGQEAIQEAIDSDIFIFDELLTITWNRHVLFLGPVGEAMQELKNNEDILIN